MRYGLNCEPMMKYLCVKPDCRNHGVETALVNTSRPCCICIRIRMHETYIYVCLIQTLQLCVCTFGLATSQPARCQITMRKCRRGSFSASRVGRKGKALVVRGIDS
jgi:hypothetical protein